MGWSTGSRILSEIIESIMENVADEAERSDIYSDLIGIFEDYDCDTIDECLEIDEVFDEVYNEKYPEEDAIDLEEESDDWDDQTGGNF